MRRWEFTAIAGGLIIHVEGLCVCEVLHPPLPHLYVLLDDVKLKLLLLGGQQDGGGGVSDRHKYDDEAGDSDDGPGPEDSDFEDEEVDEDAAFDSADEAR